MAGTITALRYQKRNKERVNVFIDGAFAFGLAAIEAAHLKVGQALTDKDIEQLENKDEVERAYERALNFLSYRPRSEAEVRRNLKKKDVADAAVDLVVERLTRAQLLDDREFARYWVENRLQFKPRGPRALRQELWQKGIPDAIIDEMLDGYDEQSAAERAAAERARRLMHLDPREFRRKLGQYLARRGFSYAVIDAVITSLRGEGSFDVESEETGNG